MSNYLFRADGCYRPGEDISARDPNNEDVSALQHIAQGSKLGLKSKYISTTKKIATAVTYSLGGVEKKQGKVVSGVEDHVRTPVLLIDCDKLKEHNVVTHDVAGLKPKPLKGEDVVTPEDRAFWESQKENDGGYLRMAQNYGLSSREVLVECRIPSDCIREVPMICVDMLEALEDCETENLQLYMALKNIILEKMMTDDEEFKQMINNIHFEGKLQEFYEAYYKEGNKSLREVSKSVFGKDDREGLLLANCSRVQIIKDIFSKFDIERENQLYYMLQDNVEKSLKGRKEFYFKQNNDEIRCGLLKDYSNIISSDVRRKEGALKISYIERKPGDNNIFMLGDSRCIKLSLGEAVDISHGISFDGNIAKPVMKHIRKDEIGEPPKEKKIYEKEVRIGPSHEEKNKFLKELQDKVKKPEEILLNAENEEKHISQQENSIVIVDIK